MVTTQVRYKDLPTLEGEEREYQRRLDRVRYLHGRNRRRLLDDINNRHRVRHVIRHRHRH
jgi:hypothetical protein